MIKEGKLRFSECSLPLSVQLLIPNVVLVVVFFLVRFARNLSALFFFSKTQFSVSFIHPNRFFLSHLHFDCSREQSKFISQF